MFYLPNPRPPAYRPLLHDVPLEFIQAAARFRVAPEDLARMLCANFAIDPPDELRIISAGVWPDSSRPSAAPDSAA